MRARYGVHPWAAAVLSLTIGWSAITIGPSGVTPAWADDTQAAQQLVDRSRLVLETFLADPQMSGSVRAVLKRAKAVLIYPQVLRLAFFFGGSGASGVLLARDEAANTWGGPAFYTIGQASFGFQAGADVADVVLVVLTDRGLSALLSTSAKFGADASVSLGPIGAGAEAATANLSADIVSYSRSAGLYAGISVNGAVVAVRNSLNQAYYGKDLSPSAILISREATNPQAAPLIQTVKAAGGN
jgi:lipid-binding SYLF domain-containing protein